MIKKTLAISIVLMLAIGFNVASVYAYRELSTPVAISASGELIGSLVAMTANVVDQATGANGSSSIAFGSPNGITDSGRVIKITGGTNEVDSRIIIYTDNNTNTTAPNKVPVIDPATGVDGSGMVGQDNPGYVVPLFWGTKSAAHNDPNTNMNYVFDGDMNDKVGEVWIVDKRHTHSFTTKSSTLDNNLLYTETGAAGPANTADDGLYPQLWNAHLYNSATVRDNTTRVSPSLYSTIATVAFGLGSGTPNVDPLLNAPDNYICRVPKLTTEASDDNIQAKLAKQVPTGTDAFLYIYIGADFGGRPAQIYSTAKLFVAMTRDKD